MRANIYTRIFDHPYFGQVLIAAALGLVNYPDFATDGSDGESQIGMLYIVPRIFMGLLAVVDTLLVYKVAERRYNKTVALTAATMFAVMPFSWLLRRILLDNLLLPFLLCSVFFALSVKRTEKRITASDKDKIMIFL